MSIEGRPSGRSPSPEELEHVYKAHQDADPTTFSELSPEHLRLTGEYNQMYHRPISTDESSLYAPISRDEQKQQVVARILKGIMNVADVVEGPDGKMYSKHLQHDRIEKETSPDELHAEAELIYLVFGDYDHKYYPSHGMKDTEHNNLRVEGNRVSHYDFGEARLGPLPMGLRDTLPTLSSLDALEEKLTSLKAHLAGTEGLALLEAIFKSSDVSPRLIFPESNGTDSVADFRDYLLRRIDHARFLVRQERASRDHKEAA